MIQLTPSIAYEQSFLQGKLIYLVTETYGELCGFVFDCHGDEIDLKIVMPFEFKGNFVNIQNTDILEFALYYKHTLSPNSR